MGTRIARMRAGVRVAGVLLVLSAATTGVRASAADDPVTSAPAASAGSAPTTSTTPPTPAAAAATTAPDPSDPVRASDWLPGSPAAADSAAADSIAAASAAPDTASAARNPIASGPGGSLSGTSRPAGSPDLARTTERPPIGVRGPSGPARGARSTDRSLRLPPNTATGVSLGYPAYPGLFIVAPADGPFAVRSGITGFPTIGLLWTPGVEYRFGQESGTLSQNGIYVFGNAFLGRSYLDSDEREYSGAEAGLGYRWLIDDRRGVRWIAAVETGGYWRGDPVVPRHLCLRFVWNLIE